MASYPATPSFGVTLSGPVRILLVDERKVAKALQEGLDAESYSIAVAPTGEEGFQRVTSEPFDLAVLDVMLPGRSGIEMLSAMRTQGIKIPVLLLTAKDTLADACRDWTRGLTIIW